MKKKTKQFNADEMIKHFNLQNRARKRNSQRYNAVGKFKVIIMVDSNCRECEKQYSVLEDIEIDKNQINVAIFKKRFRQIAHQKQINQIIASITGLWQLADNKVI